MGDGQPLKKPPGFKDTNSPVKPISKPAGPRKPTVPPTFYQTKKKRRSCCRCCCCAICIILLLLIIFLAVVTGLFYLLFQPKLPVFTFKPIELDRFNITNQPGGTGLLDSNIIIRVEAKNPNNKLRIYYGETGVVLTADQETELGSASVPEFKQPANNVTLLRFNVVANNQEIDVTVAAALMSRVKNQQVVVDAAVTTKVGIGVWGWKIGMLPVNVNCGGVTLKQINGGNTSPKCSFHTLRWITIH